MEDKLFDTDDKKKEAILQFNELINHPGWHLFVKILDANIQVAQDKLTDSETEHTKEGDDNTREKLNIYKRMKDTPKMMINDFENPAVGVDAMADLDPYYPRPVRK